MRYLDFHPLYISRAECKLDLVGWTPLDVDQCIWPQRFRNRDDTWAPDTYYYGTSRSRSQVRVYDKAKELREKQHRQIDVPGGLTRIERVYSWRPDQRVTFSDGAFLETILFRKPFSDVKLVDLSQIPQEYPDGRTRIPRLYNQEMSFWDMKKCLPANDSSSYDQDDLRDYANTHQYYDLHYQFVDDLASWHSGRLDIPDGHIPQSDDIEDLKRYVNQLIKEEQEGQRRAA